MIDEAFKIKLLTCLENRLIGTPFPEEKEKYELRKTLDLMQLLINLNVPFLFPNLQPQTTRVLHLSLILRMGVEQIESDEYERLFQIATEACILQVIDKDDVLFGISSKKRDKSLNGKPYLLQISCLS